MKIGASTLATFKNSLDDSLEFIESLGIKYVELLHQYPTEEFDLDILNSFNLDYTIHAPFMDVNIAALGSKSRANSLIPFLAREMPEEVYKVSDNSIKEIGDYSQDSGVNTTIENMPAFETMIYQDMNRLNETLVEFDMGMTFDIGHAHHSGISPDEMYFDSIKHIHAHDNMGDEDSHLALGEGNIQLKDIITTFENKKYDGIYMIEVNNKDSIKKSLEFFKNNF